jgi:hypothetical protein
MDYDGFWHAQTPLQKAQKTQVYPKIPAPNVDQDAKVKTISSICGVCGIQAFTPATPLYIVISGKASSQANSGFCDLASQFA